MKPKPIKQEERYFTYFNKDKISNRELVRENVQKKITEAKERGKKYGGDDTGSPDYDVKQDVEQDVKAYTAQIKKLAEAHNKDNKKEK